jgi:hypothetical protein
VHIRQTLLGTCVLASAERDNGRGFSLGPAPIDQNESAIAATTAALAANIRMATASGRIVAGMIGARCSLRVRAKPIKVICVPEAASPAGKRNRHVHDDVALKDNDNSKDIGALSRLSVQQLRQPGDVGRDPAGLRRAGGNECNYPAPRLYLRAGRFGRGLSGRGV